MWLPPALALFPTSNENVSALMSEMTHAHNVTQRAEVCGLFLILEWTVSGKHVPPRGG